MKRFGVDRQASAFSLGIPLYKQQLLLLLYFFFALSCTKKQQPSTTPISESVDSLTYLSDTIGYSTPLSYSSYNLIWHDEFDVNEIDTTSWRFEIGNGPSGWGNNELEYYTNGRDNAF